MNYYLLHDLPDHIKKEDLEDAFAELGSVQYVRIRPSTTSGRVAIIKMERPGKETHRNGERGGHECRGRRLRLVRPRVQPTRREQREEPVAKERGVNPLIRAVQDFVRDFFRPLWAGKPLPAKVSVVRPYGPQAGADTTSAAQDGEPATSLDQRSER